MNLYYIGNHTKTATSHNACERIIAPNFCGKNLYINPQAAPATRAAITSMKLQDPACTNAYMSVVTINPILGLHLLCKVS